MDNVRFLYFRPTGYGQGYTSSEQINLVFEMRPRLSKFIREHAQCPPHRLCEILDEDNHYFFAFNLKCDKDDPQRILRFIRNVERTSNENDDEYLFKHVITDNGKPWHPGKLRDLITTKYDVSDEDDMWKVYGFFLQLEELLLNIWDD